MSLFDNSSSSDNSIDFSDDEENKKNVEGEAP